MHKNSIALIRIEINRPKTSFIMCFFFFITIRDFPLNINSVLHLLVLFWWHQFGMLLSNQYLHTSKQTRAYPHANAAYTIKYTQYIYVKIYRWTHENDKYRIYANQPMLEEKNRNLINTSKMYVVHGKKTMTA